MEGRPVAGAARAAAVPRDRPRRWPWLLLVLAILVLGAFAAWRFSLDAAVEEPLGYSLPPDTGVEPAPLPDATAGGATIVDAPPGEGAVADPLAEVAAPASATESSAAGEAAAATAAPAAATGTRRQAANATPRATRDKAKGDEDLLGTLMGIIKEEDKPKAKAKASPASMDELIAQIQADERKQAADADIVFDQISGKNATSSTKSTIQARLRTCASANTNEGLNCRKRVCAAVAGKDPACPAM